MNSKNPFLSPHSMFGAMMEQANSQQDDSADIALSKKIVSMGSKFKKNMKAAGLITKEFFDWQYSENGNQIVFEFYWKKVNSGLLADLSNWMYNHTEYNPVITAQAHHNSNKPMICLLLNYNEKGPI